MKQLDTRPGSFRFVTARIVPWPLPYVTFQQPCSPSNGPRRLVFHFAVFSSVSVCPVTFQPSLNARPVLLWSREVSGVVTALHRQLIQRLLSACHPLHNHSLPTHFVPEWRRTAVDPLHVPQCLVHAGSARWSWTSCSRMRLAGLLTRTETAGPHDLSRAARIRYGENGGGVDVT